MQANAKVAAEVSVSGCHGLKGRVLTKRTFVVIEDGVDRAAGGGRAAGGRRAASGDASGSRAGERYKDGKRKALNE